MKRTRPRSSGRSRLRDVPWALLVPMASSWAAASGFASARSGQLGLIVAVLGAATTGLGLAALRATERRRWADPVKNLARNLAAFNDQPGESWDLPSPPTLLELAGPVRDLQGRFLALKGHLAARGDDDSGFATTDSGEMQAIGPTDARMTRSGAYEPPDGLDAALMASGEFSTLDMISRLDPRTLRWLESSHREREFLGWDLAQLREKSFLDIVQDDDRDLARQQLRAAVVRGEGHGMVYRITTSRGESKAVELNVGVRYGPDGRISHLRCHLADVTARLRDETELKRRTQELTQANDQLRRTNRELERLRDRYGDLYQNAPAMYFTVDRRGRFVECNDTLVRALGHPRAALLGAPVARLLPEGRPASPADLFSEPTRGKPIDFETAWSRSDGGVVDVWVTGAAVLGPDGKARQYRCVARDITAKRALEAELQVQNNRLALANSELSRKNKELDEFTYVVSHDLQEPLRTLIAFSDFLLRDHGDKLDESGREYVQYLVDASRRLRSLIRGLLSLSRAGKVTGEFASVNLVDVAETVRADLAELIRSKGGEVVVLGPLPEVWGDRDRLGQLLANLVGNGLKYNKGPNPRVEVSAEFDRPGRRATIAVRDNGIGIDPRFHSKIFQLFRRLHTREEYEGTGAGLAICQKIVQAHGGSIRVESEPDRGSTFFVTLPTPPDGATASSAEVFPHAP